ncbi:hypothetical protein [Kitasatospora sp. GP82]|uniref:hypothetical protein n=1 Tax=Kitasatospora sp. GP82 TaxID=3035089 RepID=UPI0024767561|nr:hypothetical protein [Kitasatospora sp. GP82]MDH6129146.1 hypothetical protein [Kitasatospora sp. GP82]
MPGSTGRRARPIYVEIQIGAAIDVVWELTQRPQHHQRWDARFSRITYAEASAPPPAATPSPPPTRFRYTLGARHGPALTGTGVTTAERCRPDGTRISALRFSSDTRLSPLQDGAGYWRYLSVPSLAASTPETVRFVTGYDYRSWPGRLGDLLDRRLVRPIVGWLTAWSFDRLRLWAERGITPEQSRLNAFSEVLARLVLAAAGALITAQAYGTASGVAVGLTVLGLSTLVPPSAVTPAARRCIRHPRDRHTARAPKALSTLERP